MLTRLSTLEGSKVRLLKDGAVPLLISMAKLRDNFIQFTAAQVKMMNSVLKTIILYQERGVLH